MKNLFIVDLESIESRYTCEWKTHVPNLLREKTKYNVVVVEGTDDIPSNTTPGAFLNFGGTTVYKATQIEKLGRLLNDGHIKDGDHFLFTDFWHPGVLFVKYMTSLLGIKVTLHSFIHAGSYDPNDFLGRLIGDDPWVMNTERAMFEAFDHVYFATEYHIELFARTFADEKYGIDTWLDMQKLRGKIRRSGFPFEYLRGLSSLVKKSDIVVFPHRIAPEKQLWMFKEIEKRLPQYQFIVCQEQNLTKPQYHDILDRAKVVWSANLQETLGIGQAEGIFAGAISLNPDRLSYSEMYDKDFLYPSEWTATKEGFEKNINRIVELVYMSVEQGAMKWEEIKKQKQFLYDNFFSASKLIDWLNESY